ncbi:DHHA1 domain-containing protein, partial [Streptomyces rimosus]
ENQRLRQQATVARAAGLADSAVQAGAFRVVTATADGGADEARALAMAVRDRMPAGQPAAVAVGSATDGKAALVVALNKSGKEAGASASDLVKRLLNGRGGGSPELAQGGGLPADRLPETLAALPKLIAEKA